ncbi:MAG: sigma-70 family RNA polymerase sigma factor [Myxococcales bacterium]|nr:sigma-70 family RNA polymerase sigma factor [Myxococcales bacterium]
MIGDTELLQAWRDGDEARGQALCMRYFEPVVRFFASKLGPDTSDLVQDTFLALVQGRDRIGDDTRFRSYLFGIAYNVLKKHLGQRYRVTEGFETQSVHDLAPGMETMLREAESLRLMQAALRRIPVSLQVALELHYWERLSSAEIAQILGIPSSTVRTHLARARAMLEEALRSETAAPEVVESTIRDLDAWAAELRGKVVQAAAVS